MRVAELTALFEQIVSELPAGAATINVDSNDVDWISLQPANAASAEFFVVFDEYDVYGVGFDCHQWEFPYERRYRKGEKDYLTEIEEMARAVIAGKCEQERRRFSLIGRIYMPDYTYGVRDLPKFCKPPRGIHRFAPYA